MRHGRELVLLACVVVVAAAGIGFELIGDDVEPTAAQPAGDRFEARSVFCPAPPRPDDVSTRVTVHTLEGDEARVGVGAKDDPADLAPDRVLARRRTTTDSLDVVGYGAPIAATVFADVNEPVDGGGAALCTGRVAATWYFPGGSTGLGFDERLIIYNPFPDEAVIEIATFTSGGERVKSRLSDIAVAARHSILVPLNQFLVRHRHLSAKVTATRGRVVAWRALIASPRGRPEGVQLSSGVTAPALAWYFPDGGVGDGFDERIALLNPSDEAAVVTVSLVTNEKVVQPPKLLEVEVGALSSRSLTIEELVRGRDTDLGYTGAIVQSTNGVPIAAERTIWYARDDIGGVASEVGATAPSTHWIVGPAGAAADTDALVVMNPGGEDVDITVTFLREGGSVAPPELSGYKVRSGAIARLPVREWTKGGSVVALVEASGPVVAERFAYSAASSDAAALMGRPVRPFVPPN